MISEAEFLAWKDDPVTRDFLVYITRKREDTKEAWASAEFVGQDVEEYAIRNSAGVARCELCRELLELDYQRLTGELYD